MSESSRRLLALAQRIAKSYSSNPNAQVVMVAGSVGRGTSDRYSDIDIDVYYTKAPTEAEREAAVAGCGGVLKAMNQDDDEWEEQLLIEDVPAATSTFLISTMESYLTKVLDHCRVAPQAQTRLSSLQNATPVKGSHLTARWRTRADKYPDGLQRAMLEEYLPFDRFWNSGAMLADRGDLLALYDILVEVERRLMGALLGLNRIYMPTPTLLKWMDQTVAQLHTTPVDLARRLNEVFRLAPRHAVISASDLITETLLLVKTHVPEFDITPYGPHSTRRRSP